MGGEEMKSVHLLINTRVRVLGRLGLADQNIELLFMSGGDPASSEQARDCVSYKGIHVLQQTLLVPFHTANCCRDSLCWKGTGPMRIAVRTQLWFVSMNGRRVV